MKKRAFLCLLSAALILGACGKQTGGETSAPSSVTSGAESAASSVTTDSVTDSSAAAVDSTPAESTASAEEPGESAAESVAEGGTENEGNTESTPTVPEVAPDAVPVSPESFAALGPDAFITLASYKGRPQIYPDEAVITNGVIANINFSGVVSGETEPRDGMVGEGYDLKVGAGTFIPGFDEFLLGRQKGETVVFDLAFPADYSNPELAGVTATWTVLINLIKTDSDEVFNNIVAESIVTAYPQDIYNSIDAIGAFDSDDLKKAYTRRWLTAKAILFKEGITAEDETYQSIESMILLTMGGYAAEEDAVAAGYSRDLIRYYVEYYMACQVIDDNFIK